MKNIKFNVITLFLLAFICTHSPVQAQFLKNLEKSLQDVADKVVEEKLIEIITEETEESLDSLLNEDPNYQPKIRGYGISNSSPAESYAFDNKIEMLMETNGDKIYIDYYLSESQDYVGSQMKDKNSQNMMTVIDSDREAIFTFMEMNGSKVKLAMDYDAEQMVENTDYKIELTGKSKTILGYFCEEYLMTGDDFTSNVWVTKEAGIRFPKGMYEVPQKKGNNQEWLKQIDGWAMEMEMTDTSGRKPNIIKMNCLSIEKTQYKLISSDYENM